MNATYDIRTRRLASVNGQLVIWMDENLMVTQTNAGFSLYGGSSRVGQYKTRVGAVKRGQAEAKTIKERRETDHLQALIEDAVRNA